MSKKKKQKKKIESNSSGKVKNSVSVPVPGTSISRLRDWLGADSDYVPDDMLSEITYYTCLKTNSEMMGKMPLKFYQKTKEGTFQSINDNIRLLDMRPNAYMTAAALKAWWEMQVNRFGNAFIWKDQEFRTSGKYGGKYVVKGFYPMHARNITAIIDDRGIFDPKGEGGGLYFQYTNSYTGESVILKNDEVLHFTGPLSDDGVLGLSVEQVLRRKFAGAKAADAYESELFEHGLTARMVLQYTGNYDDARVKEIERKYGDKLTGVQAAGKVIGVPSGLTLTPLNMSMVDADFVNIRKYDSLSIAACLNVKPSQLNIYSDSKYASCESEALAFLDSFSFKLKTYEDEINAKLLTPQEYKKGCFYKFNEQAVLRVDSKTKSEVIGNYVRDGVYKVDEAREILDLPHVEGGDRIYINGSYVPLTEAGVAYKNKTTDGGKDE